jgi:glutaredoxin
MPFARPLLSVTGLAVLLAVTGMGGSDVNAQQIYRSVDQDGRITFSDKSKLDPNGRASTATAIAMPGSAADNSALPFELRQAASRYPVTLYTAPSCAPCVAGRALLSNRGIPFTEKTVTSSEDIDALKRLAGASSLPFLTIGGQQLKGLSETEWVQFLDAAGYPKTSQLPPGYTPPAATALVTAQQPQAPARPAPAPRTAAKDPAEAPTDNPAGIRF